MLLGLAGFSEIALYQMEEVHMLLDREDPSVLNFTVVMDDAGMIHYGKPIARICLIWVIRQ